METIAVVLHEPERIELTRLDLAPPQPDDVVVDIEWSGISTGTEKLLWTGRMPPFPGMGYPLVPGYEFGRPRHRRRLAPRRRRIGDSRVRARRALLRRRARPVRRRRLPPGGAGRARRADRRASASVASCSRWRRPRSTRFAAGDGTLPELIVGHGVLGRLLARLTLCAGGPPPIVWELNPDAPHGAVGYTVIDPDSDTRRDYRAIYDVSGDPKLLDTLIGRLLPGGEVVLAGFYTEPLSFAFPPAFMREARIRIAAQWQEPDLTRVRTLMESGELSLDGLITHRRDANDAPTAYRTAFGDPACLKMILDWSTIA